MIKISAEDRVLQDMNISDIVTYLERGDAWNRILYPNSRLIAFEGPKDDNGERIILVLPAHNEFLDVKERLADAINLLAAIERIPPDNVIQKIRSVGRDTIRFRMLTDTNSSPSLDRAFEIVEGLMDLVFFAACMEGRPRAYIPGKRQKIGYEQVQNCRFGHTFSGSFGFTIELPIFELQPTLFSGSQLRPPVARRIVERITRGFILVEEAEKHQNAEIIYKNYYDGINHNMCNALLKIIGRNRNVNMEFAVLWSPLIIPNKDLGAIKSIFVEKEAYRYIQEAADFMRKDNMDVLSIASEASPELLLTEKQVIHGKIIHLSAISKNQRVATVSWNGERQVNVPLHPDLYEAAFKAHIEFLSVNIIGRLVERNHELTLLDVIDFIIEQ